jgi:ClpX C4-type zinc finger
LTAFPSGSTIETGTCGGRKHVIRRVCGKTKPRFRRSNYKLDLMSRQHKAPPVLAGLFVLAYAHVDRSITFIQRRTLNVNGKWLGRVPCLAICQEFGGGEYLVQHCSQSWNTRGVAAGYLSAAEAKASVERSYPGLSNYWHKQETSRRSAKRHYMDQLKFESCSFCGRTPLDVTAMAGKKVRICNHCIDKFYSAIHASR